MCCTSWVKILMKLVEGYPKFNNFSHDKCTNFRWVLTDLPLIPSGPGSPTSPTGPALPAGPRGPLAPLGPGSPCQDKQASMIKFQTILQEGAGACIHIKVLLRHFPFMSFS